MKNNSTLIPADRIEQKILFIRGEKVILDENLAVLYGVPTKALIQALKRNIQRFPDDFMFQLTVEENECLRSHFVTSKGRGGRRYLPYAFTEQGVAMLSSVLKSERAVIVNIEIMRTFVRLRRMIASNAHLVKRLDSLEKRYNHQFKIVFDAIRELMSPPRSKPKKIGFKVGDKNSPAQDD